MANKLPVAKHLSDAEYSLLLTVHTAHNRSMWMEQRKDYTLSDIKKIERNIPEKCLNVYYANDWWHYSSNGTWY